ncbi:MAG: hypothetical protein ABII18_06335 [bacterium]
MGEGFINVFQRHDALFSSRFQLSVSQPSDISGGNPPRGLSRLKFGPVEAVTPALDSMGARVLISPQSYTARVVKASVPRILQASTDQLELWNKGMAEKATPDTFYALGRYFNFGLRKDLAQRTLKSVSAKAIFEVCSRNIYEAFAILAFFENNSAPDVRGKIPKFRKRLFDYLYQDANKRELMRKNIVALNKLAKLSDDFDMSMFTSKINQIPIIFGYVILCAVVKNNASAIAFLNHLAQIDESQFDPKSLNATFIKRARHIRQRFELS